MESRVGFRACELGQGYHDKSRRKAALCDYVIGLRLSSRLRSTILVSATPHEHCRNSEEEYFKVSPEPLGPDILDV